MKRISLFLILICLLLSGACGLFGDKKIVASRMLTQRDAEKILGTPMRLKSEETFESESTCVYQDVMADTPSYVQASFQTFPSEEQLIAAEEMMKKVKAEFGRKIEPVEGVGDAAWLETDDISQTLHVRKNNVLFLILAEGNADRQIALDEMRRVAQAICFWL